MNDCRPVRVAEGQPGEVGEDGASDISGQPTVAGVNSSSPEVK